MENAFSSPPLIIKDPVLQILQQVAGHHLSFSQILAQGKNATPINQSFCKKNETKKHVHQLWLRTQGTGTTVQKSFSQAPEKHASLSLLWTIP